MQQCEGLSMMPLQQNDPLELFVKKRQFLGFYLAVIRCKLLQYYTKATPIQLLVLRAPVAGNEPF